MPPRLEDPRLNSPAWLREKYHDEGLSQREIADIVGCSKRPVNNRMEEYGIEKRPAHHLPNTLDEPFSDEFVAILEYMAPPPGELEDVYGYKWGDRT